MSCALYSLYFLYSSRTTTRVAAWALSSHSVSQSFGMFVSSAGPAHGFKSGHLAKLMQVLAKLLIEIISPPLTTTVCVRWEKVDPLWYVKLTAFVKGIGLSVWPSPCRSFFWFMEVAKLRASCKCSLSNVQQRWGGGALRVAKCISERLLVQSFVASWQD